MNYDAVPHYRGVLTAMTEPSLHHVACPDATGGHRMAWWQWGDASAPHLVVCVHGLSRQGRDFDVLARALVAGAGGSLRVVCPDIVGRGRSDWLQDPSHYQIPQYAADLVVLLRELQTRAPVQRLDWVGTSMGGLIGLGLFAQPALAAPAVLGRLVLNDVGPVIEWSALARIGTYLGQTGEFDSVAAAAEALQAISTGFGPHTPEQWLALTAPMLRPLPQGGWTLHYDPAIAVPFGALTPELAAAGEAALWQAWDALDVPVLLLRGEESDLLSAATAAAMGRRGPPTQRVSFAGVGHAPTLVQDDQVQVVTRFLLAAG